MRERRHPVSVCPPPPAGAARPVGEKIGATPEPPAVPQAEHDAAVEFSEAGQVDVLEASVLMTRLRALEAAFGDLRSTGSARRSSTPEPAPRPQSAWR